MIIYDHILTTYWQVMSANHQRSLDMKVKVSPHQWSCNLEKRMAAVARPPPPIALPTENWEVVSARSPQAVQASSLAPPAISGVAARLPPLPPRQET